MAVGEPAAMKPREKAHAWWASNFAGRNACEAGAGLESLVVDADPPMRRGRLPGQGRNQQVHLIQSTGVLSTACREGGPGNWGRPGWVEDAPPTSSQGRRPVRESERVRRTNEAGQRRCREGPLLWTCF